MIIEELDHKNILGLSKTLIAVRRYLDLKKGTPTIRVSGSNANPGTTSPTSHRNGDMLTGR